MNFIRTVRPQHVLCFPNKNKMLFVEYYFDSQKNIKITKTNMNELNPFLKHIYKLETDLINKKTSVDCCLSCFSTGEHDDNKKCTKCTTHLPYFSKQRCPNCYHFLCGDCFNYAENNLKNYQDFIIYYQSNVVPTHQQQQII